MKKNKKFCKKCKIIKSNGVGIDCEFPLVFKCVACGRVHATFTEEATLREISDFWLKRNRSVVVNHKENEEANIEDLADITTPNFPS